MCVVLTVILESPLVQSRPQYLPNSFTVYNDDAERKKQKIARAVDVEYRKRAGVRENRAANLNTAL
jgi:hypothetical protein